MNTWRRCDRFLTTSALGTCLFTLTACHWDGIQGFVLNGPVKRLSGLICGWNSTRTDNALSDLGEICRMSWLLVPLSTLLTARHMESASRNAFSVSPANPSTKLGLF